MKKIITLAVILFVLACAALAVCPEINATCPVHDLNMYYTGQMKIVNGHYVYLYHCPRGDEYWVRCDP
jgi:hypothetical protein